jgi:hypothetical protein
MSLTPAWSSTVYPIYWYAGGQIAALALLGGLAARQRRASTDTVVQPAHISAIAKLLLTFILLWVYLGYAQLIVIWSGNVPNEVAWYVPRMRGAWRALSLVVLIGGGAVPFFTLLLGGVRRSAIVVGALGAWLLIVHWLDTVWLVVPSAAGAQPSWIALVVTMVVVSGCAIALGAWRSRGMAPLPTGDPRLAASLEYAPE